MKQLCYYLLTIPLLSFNLEGWIKSKIRIAQKPKSALKERGERFQISFIIIAF